MSIYHYEQAFGVADKTTQAMRKAIQRWFSMYYDGTVTDTADTCQRIPYTVVSKLVRGVFGDYNASGDTEFVRQVLGGINEIKETAMQLALIGGACYLKPCPEKAGFSFIPVPRNGALIFGVDGRGRPTDMGLVEKRVDGKYYYTLLERRRVDENGYLTIQNRLFRSTDSRNLGSEIPLQNVPHYAGLAAEYCFEKPVGSIGLAELKMPMLNCVDGSCDGVSVYAAAEGLIRNIDQNEAQMNGEFSRGESRIIASRDLLDRELGLQNHLFVGLDDDPERVGMTIFSPQLREESYLTRKQEYLRNVESLVGLKRGMLSDANVDKRTATEIEASATEYALTVMSLQNAWQKTVEETLGLCKTLSDLYGMGVHREGEVSFRWDNSVAMTI